MRVEVRVKRILIRLERFQYIEGQDDVLGKIYGVYDNAPESDSLYICEKGIFWHVNDIRKQLIYSDINELKLSNNELSDHITVFLNNKNIILLPVRGRYGRLADVYSLLRFLRTTISDLIKFTK